MNAIDTNVWLYRYDTRDPAKQAVAKQLIDQVRPLMLLWQVGCEFIAASRKLAAVGFTEQHAWAALAQMQSIVQAVILPDPQLWGETQTLQGLYSLSFWDSLLVAACLRVNLRTLYTEDMGAPRTIQGLSLVNPFLAGAGWASGNS
jgi:predicted nucleic acid-binding protein